MKYLILILWLSVEVFALSGIVYDDVGQRVQGVQVKLNLTQESAITDQNGFFEIGQTTSIFSTQEAMGTKGYRIINDQLHLLLIEQTVVKLSWMNSLGHIVKTQNTQLSPGSQIIPLQKPEAIGVYFLRLQVNAHMLPAQRVKLSSKGILDELTLTKALFESKVLDITSYEEDLGRITLTMRPFDRALQTGHLSPTVTEAELLNATLQEIQSKSDTLQSIRQRFFNLTPEGGERSDGTSLTQIDWNPGVWSTIWGNPEGIAVQYSVNILNTNDVFTDTKTIYEKSIAFAGIYPTRYLAMGGNPMVSYSKGDAVSEDMHQMMVNALGWLVDSPDVQTQSLKVALTHFSTNEKSAVKSWMLEKVSDQIEFLEDCDGAQAMSCMNDDIDLIITDYKDLDVSDSDKEKAADAIISQFQEGTPLLYMRSDGNQRYLGGRFNEALGVSYQWHNYFKHLQISQLNPAEANVGSSLDPILVVLNHFKEGDYQIPWNDCVEGTCDDIDVYQTEFQEGASAVASAFKALDSKNKDIFKLPGDLKLLKLLALYADKIRENIVFPMDKVTTDDTEFLKSFFADHAHYQSRRVNAAQNDMGIYSRSDFSSVNSVSKNVRMISKAKYRTSGVYAIPGRTVRVIRKDQSGVKTHIRVHSLRNGSTKIFNENKYIRPRFLWGVNMEIAPGDTLDFTSAYGGPIHIQFDSNNEEVEFDFIQVGLHPVWRSPEDNESFTLALEQGEFDWAEIVTDGFEVHSTLEKMRSSIANEQWSSPAVMAAATESYMSNYPHVLAGFRGPGIDSVPQIHDFASRHQLEVQFIDIVKHMNADQATCGSGCSGNPYDAFWSFNPTGHGDLHELGHGLEKGRFRFDDWEGHSTTNYYSYFSKSQYFKASGRASDCQNLPFETQFNWLQEAARSTDSFTSMQSQDMSSWSQGAAMVVQMMMLAQHEGTWTDGWHLLSGLHLIERAYGQADNNEDSWNSQKANLGFADYTFAELGDLTRNDWFAIAISWSMERDMRDYLDMWGIELSEKAKTQINNYGFSRAPQVFFASSAKGYCTDFEPQMIAIDGTTPWPL